MIAESSLETVPTGLAEGTSIEVFSDIYRDDITIATYQRTLTEYVRQETQQFLLAHPDCELVLRTRPREIHNHLLTAFSDAHHYTHLIADITHLIEAFSYLLALDQVGVRLTALNRAMCPKFHVDRVPCRLVTTYQGVATQWLAYDKVDYTKLSVVGNATDQENGVYSNNQDIQQLTTGDVSILKGTKWYGNEATGLVHRSPALEPSEVRLLLTLDLVS